MVIIINKYIAEFLGTCWLVFGGCGSAVLAAAYPELGIGFEAKMRDTQQSNEVVT
jgi:glycerol uptake facilitator-like aquaporin